MRDTLMHARAVIGILGAILASAGACLVSWAGAPGPEREGPSLAAVSAKDAVAPAAPLVPGELSEALRDKRYAEASAGLAALAEKAAEADDRAYFRYLQGMAERLAGKPDAARETLRSELAAAPRSRWAAKLRFELAGVEQATGRLGAAEDLTSQVAGTLLDNGRKDALAEVYQAFARQLLEPEGPIVQPDPKAAYQLLAQAHELAKGPALRARLLRGMGRAGIAAENFPQAIASFQRYLKDHPQGDERFRVRLELGQAQHAAHEELPARTTWSDLARDIERLKADQRTAEIEGIRAEALWDVASTYGMPAPPDDARLNQGVAALKRFLAVAPKHPKAVRAAYQIAAAYQARGKDDPALDAFNAFLKEDGPQIESDEARRDWAELSMTASFQVGRILKGQRKFAEAIAAWKGYLAKFPNGPQSADAQRAIIDARLAIAEDHLQRGHRREARAAWNEFAAANPIDARVPNVLFQIGASFESEKLYDKAIAAWEALIGKFPDSEPAAHAQFQTAAIFETEKGEPAEAVERFRMIQVEPWKGRAGQRVAVMESKQLVAITPRAFRTGEPAHLEITTRNIETLHFTAYKLDAEAYFRKKNALANVESLDIGLVAPDAEWDAPVPGQAKYKPVKMNYELKKLELPGVYVVKVTDEKSLQATTLVIGSDIDAIVKTSRDQALVFVQDMKTGRGRPNARVLVADGGEIAFEGTTGADGVLLRDWDKPRALGRPLNYLILDGPHVAGSNLSVPNQAAQGLTARAYIDTDRPAYRPGQTVSIRGVVREVENGQYALRPKAAYHLEVADSRGRRIAVRSVGLSEFGTFHESVPLGQSAPQGTYRITVFQPGKSTFHGAFEVQSYQLQPIDLKFDVKQRVVYRGETVRADLTARYQYGAPLASRPIDVALPDGRVLHGTTDAEGKYHIEFPTDGFGEEQTLRIAARLPQEDVAAVALVRVALRGFEITLHTTRTLYLDGESFALDIVTTDAQGEPIGEALSAALVQRNKTDGRLVEREVARESVTTDAKTGRGSVDFRASDRQGGQYVLRVAGTDRFGTAIVADRAITISGRKDQTKLRLLTDRQRFKVGEAARINLHSRDREGTALLAWEADRVLSYRIVALKKGDNPVEWKVEGAQFPNFTLTAARMWHESFDQARLDVQVERDLRVTVKPVHPVVEPGKPIELDVKAVDQLGRPVAAELSIAMVDQSLLRLFRDQRQAIGPFFYNQTRTGSFSASATNTFRYQPQTVPVSRAVVEEEEIAMAEAKDAAERDKAREKAGLVIARSVPAPMAPGQSGAMMDVRMQNQQGRGGAKGQSGQMGRMMAPAPAAANQKAGASRLEADMAQGSKPGDDRWAVGLAFEMPEGRRGELAARRAEQYAGRARQQFTETAYWNPSVVTDSAGKARVTFNAPSALSEYRIMARGVTGADTLAGQTTATVTVRKNFFVDLKAPSSLTQGDKPRFIARVHHLGLKGEVSLKLTAYAGGRDDVLRKTITLAGDGVDEVIFDPYEVPEGGPLRLTLTGALDDAKDELVLEVPIHPWGTPVYASASGTGRESTTVFVELPAGRSYENLDMLITLSPTLRRMLIELALGHGSIIWRETEERAAPSRIMPPLPNTLADRAAELLASASVLEYLHQNGASAAPEAHRLIEHIQGLVAELTAAQNPDGGWPWVRGPIILNAIGGNTSPPHPPGNVLPMAPHPPGGVLPNTPGTNPSSDRLTSAAVLWALAAAEPLGLVTEPKSLDQGVTYLQNQFAQVPADDLDGRAAVLHALSTRRAASFEAANSLNRLRDHLSSPALAYLALTFVNLNRAALAGELLDVLAPRAKEEAVAPGRRARLYWEGSKRSRMVRGTAETTALVGLAFAKARPQAPQLERAVDWMLAHRIANQWREHKAKGPALAALSSFYGKAQGEQDRYRLAVTVNDAKVATIDVAGAAEEKAVAVPRSALKPGQANRVRFEMEGRGQFGYAVMLSGFTREFKPDQDRTGRSAWIERRIYTPAAPELDGKALPVGFSVAVRPEKFENLATQVALGGKARVAVTAHRDVAPNTPDWERDFLIVRDQLPAGTTLIDGSLQTRAASHELADGVLTLYFPPNVDPGTTTYEVHGYLPGAYRTLPASIQSAYGPGRFHLGQPGALKALAPGEAVSDPYKPTPDELYARGKAHFEADRLDQAATALGPLYSGYTLRDDVLKDAARMLLMANIHSGKPREIVQYFEVVKEKSPGLYLTFDQLRKIGSAYRDIREPERAMIVWRGLIEASYLEDARVGELLRQRGKALEATAYLINLWRAYPSTAAIETDFYGLSQLLISTAGHAFSDAGLRRELANAGTTRSELLLQAVRMIQTFLTQAPTNPMADEASLALLGAFLALEDHATALKLAPSFAKRFPKSTYLDSFQYIEALADFHLGHHDRAMEVAGAIARATYRDASGADRPSPNKWQALYILGQIHDARREPAKALEYYRRVAERFSDAASAIKAYTRKELSVPEISIVHPAAGPAVAEGAGEPAPGRGFRAIGVAGGAGNANANAPAGPAAAADKPGIHLDYRNVAKVDVKAYPVDLMQLYLVRRNLDGIAGIDLAGIAPLLENTIELGDGADYGDKSRSIDLPIKKDGAYLVMLRGAGLYASGVVLVSPIEIEVLEDAQAGRARVTLRDAQTKAPLPKVQVKAIGSDDPRFVSGETDLRGVFNAEGLHGTITVVARKGTDQYAFHRGTQHLGPRHPLTAAPTNLPQLDQGGQAGRGRSNTSAPVPLGSTTQPNQALDANINMLNSVNCEQQVERLRKRYEAPANNADTAVPSAAPAGEFR